MSGLSQGKGGQIDAVSKEIVPKFAEATKLVRNSLKSIDPLEGATFSKGLIAELHTASRCDAVEQLAPSEYVVRYFYH